MIIGSHIFRMRLQIGGLPFEGNLCLCAMVNLGMRSKEKIASMLENYATSNITLHCMRYRM